MTGVHYGIDYIYYYPVGTHNTTLARAVPINGYTFKLTAYEDDDEGCVHHSGDDHLGSWPTGLQQSQYGYWWFTESPSDLYLVVWGVTPFE